MGSDTAMGVSIGVDAEHVSVCGSFLLDVDSVYLVSHVRGGGANIGVDIGVYTLKPEYTAVNREIEVGDTVDSGLDKEALFFIISNFGMIYDIRCL